MSELLDSILANAITTQANKPQKTGSLVTSTPNEYADMFARRNSIGSNSVNLANMLKLREGGMYGLANSLANLPGAQTEGTGAGLLNFAKAFGGTYNARANSMMDNAQKQYDTGRTDLADALMFDKSMGEQQREQIGYIQNTQAPKELKTDTAAPLPKDRANWGESTLQAGALNPDTGVPTIFGAMTRSALTKTNPEGINARQANVNAYTKTFTIPQITALMSATGGSRGIDTMPEVNIKGGPELSSANMTSEQYKSAVQDQAYDVAGQVLAANPNAQISREELSNAILNNFNSNIQEKYRVVDPIGGSVNTDNQGKSPEELDKLLGEL